MSDHTNIEWTDATWNPTVGCDQISPGCARCYAKTLHDRRHKAYLAGKPTAPQYAQPFEVLQSIESRLDAPLHWREPRMVFVNSVSDLFHEDVPDAFIGQVFAVMALSPQHTFQVLTKRPARMVEWSRGVAHYPCGDRSRLPVVGWPPNVWLGVSVENQHFADERIPLLLQTEAAVRFISAEPLLEAVDLSNSIGRGRRFLDWVIVGGESGPGARPCDVAWIRSILAQCQAAGVPCFVKQLGAQPVTHGAMGICGEGPLWRVDGWPKGTRAPLDGDHFRLHLHDPKGGDPAEWPVNLRVREFPRAAGSTGNLSDTATAGGQR